MGNYDLAMRRVGSVTLVLGLAVLTAGSALAAHAPTMQWLRVKSSVKITGTVRALGLTQITVGRTRCSLRSPKITNLASTFAVGENVTVGCVDGSLRSIVLAPITSGQTHPDLIVSSPVLHSSAPVTAAPAAGVPSGCSVGGGIGFLTWTSGTTGSRSVTGTVCVTGTITAVGPTGISIGDQTCGFPALANPLASSSLLKNLQVGEQAVMGCTNFSNGQSEGSISVLQTSSG